MSNLFQDAATYLCKIEPIPCTCLGCSNIPSLEEVTPEPMPSLAEIDLMIDNARAKIYKNNGGQR